MVLSGTLREFILADVLQLLTQQKVTGKLVIDNNRGQGTIIFKNGIIVGATREAESFTSKLFYYLVAVLNQPRNKVRELFSSYEGNVAELTEFLEKKQILTHHDLENYATTITIDIACSLFLWTSGKYYFDSLRTVDHLIPAGIALPVENIVMEAMRRIDEWHRMKEVIGEDMVFIRTDKPSSFSELDNPLENPSYYYLQHINGTITVKALLEDAFHSEYKIYESLYGLIQAEAIRPLSDKLTQSVHAALNRSETDKTIIPPVTSILIAFGILLGIFLLAFIFKSVLLQDLTIKSALHKNGAATSIAREHRERSEQFLRFNTISTEPPPVSPENSPLVSKQDAGLLDYHEKLTKKTDSTQKK